MIVATKDDPVEYGRLLSCLVEPNQEWARNAPALGLAVASLRFERNGRENPAALHDLGLAAGNLSLEVTARGPYVHWMIGILPDRARALYGIPEGFRPLTGFAIGFLGDIEAQPREVPLARCRGTDPQAARGSRVPGTVGSVAPAAMASPGSRNAGR